jgi:predicted transcriptional regulator
MIPGLGSIIGGITVSVFAGASTYALGEVFKKHFSSGGTILDFDPERLRKLYKEQFEKGKKVVEEIKKKEDSSPAEKQSSSVKNDVINRLRELAELKDQGIITDEEFSSMKKKILEE